MSLPPRLKANWFEFNIQFTHTSLATPTGYPLFIEMLYLHEHVRQKSTGAAVSKKSWIRTLTNPSDKPEKALISPAGLKFPNLLQSYHFSFKSLDEASVLAEYLSSLYPPDRKKRIELGLNELFLNAIEHGNLGINASLKSHLKATNAWEREITHRLNHEFNQHKDVSVSLDITPDYLSLKISDQGDGFNWREFNETYQHSAKAQHGRGLIMCKELCFDEMVFSEKGNEVICTIYL